jgi:ankyrin repeat protein
MMRAVEINNVDMIRSLAALGSYCNLTARDGHTAVSLAVKHGHIDAVRTLGEVGADFNSPTEDGDTPLVVAIREGSSIDMIRALVEFGANIDALN